MTKNGEYTYEEALRAFKVALDKFYDSGFNPAIDYEKIFSDALIKQ